MKQLLTSLILLLACTSIQAQDPHSSYVGASSGIYNPASAGVVNGARTRIELNSRMQWGSVVGRENQFRTYSFALDSYICLPWYSDVLAIGVYAIEDRRGGLPLKRFDGNIAVAYRKLVDKNSQRNLYLSLGGKLGLIGHRVDYDGLTFDEQFDNPAAAPEITGQASSLVPDYGVGITFSQLSKTRIGLNYEIGLSMLHLNEPDFSLLEQDTDQRLGQQINKLIVGHIQLGLPLNRVLSFNPSLVYRRQLPHQQLLLTTDFMWEINREHYFSIGAGCRFADGSKQWHADALVTSFGLLFGQQLELSFLLDTGIYVQKSKPQSLEVQLAYRFGNSKCQRVYCSGL